MSPKTKRKLWAIVTGVAISVAAFTWMPTKGHAQSMTPMRGEVKSMTNEFAIRVHPKNPYPHRIKVEVRAYDQDFVPVKANIAPSEMMLGSGNSRPVLVRVGFDGNPQRKIRICTESIPFPNEKQIIRTQICGKFIATQLH